MKTNIEKQLREKVGADRERELFANSAHNALAAILREKWEGKKITSRIEKQFIETFIPAELREQVACNWSVEYGMAHLDLWGVTAYPSHTNRLRMFVGCATDPTEPRLLGANFNAYRAAAFEQTDICHGSAAQERNAARFTLCQNGGVSEIAEAVQAVIDAKAKLEKLIEHGTPGDQVRYFAQELAGIKS